MLINYHCPYSTMKFEVTEEIKEFNFKKKIYENYFPNKKL